LILLTFFSSGCEGFERVRACQRLAKAVNPTLDQIASMNTPPTSDPGQISKIAARYAALGKELTTKPFGGLELTNQVLEYNELMTEVSGTLEELAKAEKDSDQRTAKRLRSDLERIAKREKRHVSKINSTCAGAH
jgi:hypothetical protein